jgi:hypothetical protein
MDRAGPRRTLPSSVILLGFTSFFTDVGAEMIYPMLPLFVASLGATPVFLGLVEGVADATARVLPWLDRWWGSLRRLGRCWRSV